MNRKTTQFDAEVFEIDDLPAFRERVNKAKIAQPWEQLTEEGRRALCLLVRDLLLRLLEEPIDGWLPQGLIAASGSDVAVVLHLRFGNIHARVIQLREEAEREHAARRRRYLALLRELNDDLE